MQPVDILRDESKVRQGPFHFGDGLVGGVGFAARDGFTTPIVKLPYQFGVFVERLGGGQVCGTMVLPQSSCATKSGDTAFGRDTCPGEYRYRLCQDRQLIAGLRFYGLLGRLRSLCYIVQGWFGRIYRLSRRG